ncbi:MAG: ATP-binding cassette domain-containing protein [Thermosynechococcaceae cyanobacterium]
MKGSIAGSEAGLSNPSELLLADVVVVSPTGQALLREISFAVPQPGAKIGIVGASGSGKTTLLRTLNRLINPTSGQILWQGKSLDRYPSPALRQHIMLVPQEPRLLGMSVEQALAYPLQLQKQHPASAIQQQVQQWCQRLGVPEDWRSRQELELSVGQRQWVSLVRGLAAQPSILLLDEPTSALDAGRIEQLIQVLRQVDCTILVASHQLDMVKALCDRILWLDQGTLKQDRVSQCIDWSEIQSVLAETATQPAGEWE